MSAFEVRQARPEDARELAELFAAVDDEGDGIATEPPVDIDARTKQFTASIGGAIVAVAAGNLVGSLHVETTRFGFGDLGMLVTPRWRGRGVGSALGNVMAAVDRRTLQVVRPRTPDGNGVDGLRVVNRPAEVFDGLLAHVLARRGVPKRPGRR